jgi:putative endonuclease
MFWVYTLLCEDDSLYTGFTDDIKRRIYVHYHQLKSAAKYTKSHKVCGISAFGKPKANRRKKAGISDKAASESEKAPSHRKSGAGF